MRFLGLLSIGAAAVIVVVACGESGPPQVQACAGAPSATPRAAAPARREPLLGLLERPNSAVFLARLDPLSLRPVSREVEVGEYHEGWSLSPDGSQLALGRGGQGIGIVIVDLKTMRLARQIHTGIAVEALGWLAPRLLVAGLQRGGTVIVDPRTGRIVRRWRALSFPDASARIGDAIVMLYPGLPLFAVASASPRLAVVDAQGRLRSVTLKRIRLAVHSRNGVYYADRAGLALDPVRARAYVFAADAPFAEVNLRSIHVSYHRLEPLLRPGELEGGSGKSKSTVLARERGALWLGDRQVVVFGRDFVTTHGPNEAVAPAGAALVDTTKWSACLLDGRASGAAFAANRLLVYRRSSPASRGIGVRAFTARGGKAFHLFGQEQVWAVETASGRAYVRTPDGLHVVDVGSGKVVNKIAAPPELDDVITRPP